MVTIVDIKPWLLQLGINAATVLSQGARNVNNGVLYGGASAVGDGVHDDRHALLDAFLIIIFLLLLPMTGVA